MKKSDGKSSWQFACASSCDNDESKGNKFKWESGKEEKHFNEVQIGEIFLVIQMRRKKMRKNIWNFHKILEKFPQAKTNKFITKHFEFPH